jgi:tRNA 2-(methylsulfanyl)-N6-isopentenyladenosine37 hydroxylase
VGRATSRRCAEPDADRGADGDGIGAVLSFLNCRTPAAWVERAVRNIPLLLLDHASLELKAAEQAQKIIRRYGAAPAGDPARANDLVRTMSRLAREELRHFEQVVSMLETRGIRYRPVSPSRYATELHVRCRRDEPGRRVDTFVIGAVIEARSCERFDCLGSRLDGVDPPLARFYRTLLKSEARHFGDYLAFAEQAAGGPVAGRVAAFVELDAALVHRSDAEVRFLGGVPDRMPAARAAVPRGGSTRL